MAYLLVEILQQSIGIAIPRIDVCWTFPLAHLLSGGGMGSPARMRCEKSGASPAACARALMWLSRLSSAKGRLVSSRPISYAYSGAYPLKSTFQLYRAMPPDARAWNKMVVVQLVVSVL
jgi:hypothetical protein